MVAVASTDRVLSLGSTSVAIPERLLLAHARGEVLFIVGAGVSRPAGLPDFRDLVVLVYLALDKSVHNIIKAIPRDKNNVSGLAWHALTNQQKAEVVRFVVGDYDVVLGMLERRLDGKAHGQTKVRQEIVRVLRNNGVKPAAIHHALMRLSDRGGAAAIVTTNFDLLLEIAATSSIGKVESYALGGIPRPARSDEFNGIFHIHGALEKSANRTSDLVVSDQDFGEFYLRRRIVPDFIYDAARLFHLVLVGYSANDPPMRYLLNAVAADGARFDDLKERFTFFGKDSPDPVALEDWKARGITPIYYDSANYHADLLNVLQEWADLSPINGKKTRIENEVKRIVRQIRSLAPQQDRDLFDFLFRRSNLEERRRISSIATKCGADFGWLNAIRDISLERSGEQRK